MVTSFCQFSMPQSKIAIFLLGDFDQTKTFNPVLPRGFRIKPNLLSLARISAQDLSPIHCQCHLLTTPWSLFFSTSGNLIEMQILGPQKLGQDSAICVFLSFPDACNVWESLLESRWYSCLPHYCTRLLRLKSRVNPSKKTSQSPFPPLGRWFFTGLVTVF